MVSLAVGATLLTAAAFKFFAPSFGGGGGLLALTEAALAIWLVSGWHRAWSRIAALLAFSAFTGASLRSALAGAPTCGCFGTIMVDPAFVFVLDSGVVLALLLTPARHGSPSIARWGMVEVYGVAAIALIALLVSGPAASSVAALEANPSEYVFSRGRQLVQASTLAKPLSSGDWRVLFHRPGCEACRASVERFVRPEARVSIRHAMIEVARRSASVQERNVHGVLTGRLGDDAAFVETPLLLELRAGVVTRINFRGLAEEDAR